MYFDLAKFSLLSLGEMEKKKFDTLADLPLVSRSQKVNLVSFYFLSHFYFYF